MHRNTRMSEDKAKARSLRRTRHSYSPRGTSLPFYTKQNTRNRRRGTEKEKKELFSLGVPRTRETRGEVGNLKGKEKERPRLHAKKIEKKKEKEQKQGEDKKRRASKQYPSRVYCTYLYRERNRNAEKLHLPTRREPTATPKDASRHRQ